MTQTEQLKFDFDNSEAKISRVSSDEFQLSIGEFDGPLDLLLYLIKREEANIFDIPISKITDEYLSYVKVMESFDITVAGEFLVMAATLIEIKSKMLLPPEPTIEGEEEIEDPRKELVDRLVEYQQFKNAAEMLWSRATVEQATFTRGQIESDETNLEVSATIFDLFEKFQVIIERHQEEIEMEIKRDEISLTEMIAKMKQRLAEEKMVNLMEFFKTIRSRHELVLAFVSVLEIVKAESVFLTQTKTFGDIILRAKPAN